jgi:hypothetical protein
LPASHCGGPGSIPGQSMWDLRWTKWHMGAISIPLLAKTKKLIIFITGLHNKPQGCGASVAPAAGPFTTKKCSTRRSGRCTPGKEHQYPLNMRFGGPQSRCGRFGEEENLLPLPGFESRIVQPLASSLYRPSEISRTHSRHLAKAAYSTPLCVRCRVS